MKIKNSIIKERINELFSKVRSLEKEVLALKRYFKFLEREKKSKIFLDLRV